jgi:hypothetical protein
MPKAKPRAATAQPSTQIAGTRTTLQRRAYAPPPTVVQAPKEPKYMIDVDGHVLPYNADVASQNPHLKLAYAMPTSYVVKMQKLVEHRKAQELARAAYEQEYNESVAALGERQRASLRKTAGAILPSAETDHAQNLVDAADSPGEFVLEEASAAELVEFAKDQFNATLDPDMDIELLREEVAMLAGIDN